MTVSPPTTPGLPDDLAQKIEGKDSGTANTLLSIHRTGLSDLRSHLANERTHLAYLRTAVSLIGFGITLNRFSIFLEQQGKLAKEGVSAFRDGQSAGAGMVIVGLALTAWSLFRYVHVSHDIRSGVFRPLNRAVFMVTLLLLLMGGFTAVWLFIK